MKRALGAAVLFVALAAAAAFASSTTNEQPTVYMILLPDDSIEKGKAWPKSEDECLARAKAISGSCSIRRKFVTTTTCADEKAPKVYLSKADVGGGVMGWELPGAAWDPAPGDDTQFIEMADLLVRNAAWPGGYPNCWVKGRAPRAEWRFNSKDEPGKAFMEHLEPGMVAEDQVEELPNDETPVIQSAEFQAEWKARQAAEAEACAAGDTKQCQTHTPVPTACGEEFCGVRG